MRETRRILFLCTGNSCRSQMAEGWARALGGGAIEAFSAGTAPKGLDPRAVRAMAEAGVDISRQSSKGVESLRNEGFDLVVTVCDAAREACPVLPGATETVHVGFEDPPRLAAGAKSGEEAMGHYRRVRDEIKRFVESLAAGSSPRGRRSGDADGVRYFKREDLALRPDVPGAGFWAVALDRVMLTYFEVGPGACFERHSHEAEQITMVLEGVLEFECGGRGLVRVGPGEVIALPSGVPHAVRAGAAGAKAIDAWSPPRSEYLSPKSDSQEVCNEP